MKNDTLLEALKKGSASFTLSEIEEMMNEELNKDPEKMDTELIDLCAEILNKAYSEEENEKPNTISVSKENNTKKGKKIKFGKILLIAAIVAVILAVSIPVGGRFFHSDADEQIADYTGDHFHMDLQNGNMDAEKHSDGSDPLIKALQNTGIQDVIIPAAFLSDPYSAEISFTYEDEYTIQDEIEFKNESEGFEGNIAITKYKDKDFLFAIGQSDYSSRYDTVNQITVNGMDVLIFSGGDMDISVAYVDKDTDYSISFDENCTLEQAIEIVKSLGNE